MGIGLIIVGVLPPNLFWLGIRAITLGAGFIALYLAIKLRMYQKGYEMYLEAKKATEEFYEKSRKEKRENQM